MGWFIVHPVVQPNVATVDGQHGDTRGRCELLGHTTRLPKLPLMRPLAQGWASA
jgi:hypothetical protein